MELEPCLASHASWSAASYANEGEILWRGLSQAYTATIYTSRREEAILRSIVNRNVW